MDDIREWISDNLRYILLGLALILVLLIAVLGIRAISNIAAGKDPIAKSEKTETETDSPSMIVETEAASTADSTLVENDAKVLTTMTSYYSARTNNDTTTLQKLDPSTSEQDPSSLSNNYVESYSNIRTYSKAGLADGSYLVYVCYDGKVKDIDTLVPSLTQFYLMTNEEGGLYIADTSGDTAIEQFIEESRTSSEVQTLIAEVKQNCENAENQDPALKEFMEQYGNSQNSESGDTETEAGESTEMVANDACNVRSQPNTDGDILYTMYVGETITKTGESDDWTIVDYNGQTAYVKSEFLSTPEEMQEQQDASWFEPAGADDGSGTV